MQHKLLGPIQGVFFARAALAVLLICIPWPALAAPDMIVRVLTEDSQGKRSGLAGSIVTITDDNGTTLACKPTDDNGTATLDLSSIAQGHHLFVRVSGHLREGVRLYQSGTDVHGLQAFFIPGMEQIFIVMPSGQVWPDYLQWEPALLDNATEPAHGETERLSAASIPAPGPFPAPYMRADKGSAMSTTAKPYEARPWSSTLPCVVEMHLSNRVGNPLSGIDLQLQAPVFLTQSATTDATGKACIRMPAGVFGPYCGLLVVDADLPGGLLFALPAAFASGLTAVCWIKAFLPVPFDLAQGFVAKTGQAMTLPAPQAGAQPGGGFQETAMGPAGATAPADSDFVPPPPAAISRDHAFPASDFERHEALGLRSKESRRPYALWGGGIVLGLVIVAGIYRCRTQPNRRKE